jgi:hypothetical protein
VTDGHVLRGGDERNWFPVVINASIMMETMWKSGLKYGYCDKNNILLKQFLVF